MGDLGGGGGGGGGRGRGSMGTVLKCLAYGRENWECLFLYN